MSAITGATVGVALGIDVAIGVASLLLFSVLRICRPTNRYYDPRTYYGASSTRRSAGDSGAAAAMADGSHAPSLLFPSPSPLAPPGESGMPLPGAPLPPVLPRTLLTWVVPLLRLPEQRVIAAVGLDVAMLLRFIRFALKLLLVLMVWCVGVVLPVNYSGTNLSQLRNAQQLAAANPAAAQQLVPPAAAAATAATPPGFFGSLFFDVPTINSSLMAEYPAARQANSSIITGPAAAAAPGGAPKVQLGPGQDLGSLAEEIEQGRVGASDLDVLSMANISAGSRRLWVHLASVYVVTAITLRLLWSATSDALRLYLAHLSSSSSNLDSASHTALLTDIPGLPRGTAIDKVLHAPLFWLLPANVKRRLKATWFQFFERGRAQLQGTNAGPVAEGFEGGGGGAGGAAEHGSRSEQDQAFQQQQQQQQQAAGSSTWSANAAHPDTAAVHVLPRTAAAAAAPGSVHTLDSRAAAGHEQSSAHSPHQQQQLPGHSDRGGVRYRSAAAPPPAAIPSSSNTHHALLALPASQQHPRQQQQQQQQSCGGDASTRLGGTALDDALRVARAQGVGGGAGGIGALSDEWRRAARAMQQQGLPLREFVLREFREVYGAHNVVAVHIVSYSPRIARLVQQYNSTRLALEDMLDCYSWQLHDAAAAAGRRRKRSRVAAALAAPWAGLARCCGADVAPPHADREVLQPIKVRTLPFPKPPKAKKGANKDAEPALLAEEKAHGSAGSIASSAAAAAVPAGPAAAAMNGAVSKGGAGAAGSTPLREYQEHDQHLPDIKQQQQQQQQQQQLYVRQARGDEAGDSGGLLPVAAAYKQLDGDTASRHRKQDSSKAWSSSSGKTGEPATHNGVVYATGGGSSSTHSTGASSSSSSSGGCCGRQKAARRGDACDVLLAQLAQLQQQLADAHSAAEDDPLPAAFVTFRTRSALTAAVSSHHVAEAGVWKMTAAPPPDSLNWGKLGLRYWEVGLRRGVVYTVLVLLAFTYVVPVAVVQGLLQLERLQALPVIGRLVTLPGVRSLLLGVLPGLALRIFVLLLPVILYALNRRAGPVGAAQLDGWVATHFFALQVIIVFFASFITGSLFNQINVLFTQGLAPVLDRLGTGAPQTANFFILYIIFTAFIGRSFALLRPWGLFMSSIRALAARNRGRSGRRRALLMGTYRMFGPSVPEHSMMLLLALVLSVIAPLVLCAAFVFFCMALVVETYNWVWVFRRPYEGGGRLWKQMFRHVFIALYVFQIIMAALLIVKRFVWVALLVPLFFVTALVQHIGSKLLQRSWDVLSVRAAHELDVQDRQEALMSLAASQQPQLAGKLAGNSALAGQAGDGLAGQPHAGGGAGLAAGLAAVSTGAAGGDGETAFDADAASADARLADELCRSQAELWAQLYRPPAQQLLEVAGQLQEQLAARVVAMQARIAAHNAAAAAEAGLKEEARHAAERV